MPINPLVGAELVGLGSNFLSGLFGIGGQKMQFEQQKKLIDHQFQKNVEMWNKQNEYNAPTAQMKRLQDAGLNPNLVYGDGAVGNSAGSPPEYALAKAPNYAESINHMLQPFSLQGQLIAQQIQESKSREQLNGVEHMLKTLDKQFAERTLDERVDYLFKENEKKLAKYGVDIALGKNQIRVGNSQIHLNYAQMQVAYKNASYIEENTKLTKNQSDLVGKRLSVFDVAFETEQSFKKSQTALNKSASALNYAHVSESEAKTAILEIEKLTKTLMDASRVDEQAAITKQQQYKEIIMNRHAAMILNPYYYQGIIASQYFQGLSSQKQYSILNAFGMLQAAKTALSTNNMYDGLGSAFLGIGSMISE